MRRIPLIDKVIINLYSKKSILFQFFFNKNYGSLPKLVDDIKKNHSEEHEVKEKTFTTETQRHREETAEILRIFLTASVRENSQDVLFGEWERERWFYEYF